MDKLKHYRKKIDLIDRDIIKLLLLRFKLVKLIVDYKRTNNLKVIDKKRELQVINHIKKYSNNKHKNFIYKIFKNIITYSRKIEYKNFSDAKCQKKN